MRALLASPCSRVYARRFRVAPRRRLAPARALPETDRVGVVPEYGDPTFDAAVREAFDSGRECVADAEQARTLWDHGWDVLDVRDAHEIEFHEDFPNPPVGTIEGVFETIVVSGPHKVRAVPIVTSAGYRFDPDAGSKVFANKTRNPGFEAAVSAAFPNKAEAKIIVSCSDGRQRAVAALETLEAMGYERLVLLRGVQPVQQSWTKKLGRRLRANVQGKQQRPGDVGYGHMPEMNNANDAIEFDPAGRDRLEDRPLARGGAPMSK